MKTLLKIFAGVFALAVILLITVVVYVTTLDPNDHKDWIADRFEVETGRTLSLDGEIALSFYPWLGLEVNGITVGNAEGFGDMPFLHADHVKLRIKLLPLLKEQYEVDTVRLYGAEVNLAKNEAGISNWADLVTGAETDDSAGLPLAAVVLGGVDIRDAALSWDDRSTGVRYAITNLSMSTDELVYGEPIELKLNLDAAANKPELTGKVNLTSTLTYDLDAEKYDIAPFELLTRITGPNVPNGVADIGLRSMIHIDLGDETLSVSGLELDALGTRLSGTVDAGNILSDAPSLHTDLKLVGEDLAVLFKVAEIEPLATQIAGLGNRAYDFSAVVDADMQRGNLEVSGLKANLLGASINAEVKAANIQTSSPVVKGRLNATGPDLPTLMQVLGRLQGGAGSALTEYGTKLGRVSTKSFAVNADFDADLANGNIRIPVLSVDTLGIKLDGNLNAVDMQKSGGSINGKLQLSSSRPGGVLTALDQAELAEVLQSFNLDAGISGSRSNLHINPMELKLVFAGKQIPNSPVDLTLNAGTWIDLDKETLSLDSFRLAGLGLDFSGKINASDILRSPAFNGEMDVAAFNLRRFMQQLNQELPDTADKKVFEKVSLASAFDGSAKHMNISRLALVLDETNLNGSFSVTDFDKPAIQFAIDIDRINADRYLPPTVEGEQAKPLTPETAAGAAATLPLEMLQALNIRGDLKIGNLTISKARLSNVVFSLNAKDGKISLSPASASLYRGSYQGDINLDASGAVPALSAQTRLQGVELAPLMTDFMGASTVSGTANVELSVKAEGVDADAFKKNLNGTGKINLDNGVLQGIDVARVLEQVEIMVESKRLVEIDRGQETPFDSFSSTLQITDGVVRSDDLLISAPGWRVSGKGTVINLNDDTLSYNLVASADPRSATREEERYNIGGYTVPIQCRGQVSDPSCLPDVGEIVKVAVQKEVEKKIGNFLQKALGVPEPTPAPAQPAESGDGTTAHEPAQQPQQQVDPAKELMNKALKSIFR